MKTKRCRAYLMAAAVLSIAATACSEELNPAEPAEREIEITAVAEAVVTRTQIDPNSEYGYTGILWSPGDKIGVFGTSTANAEFTSTNSKAAPSATFTGTSDTPRYAYYPYSGEAGSDPKGIKLSINSVQSYNGTGSITANDLKVSSGAMQKDGKWNFNFRPVTSMLRFSVNTSGLAAIASDETLQSIKIYTDGTAIAGEYTIDITEPDAVLTAVGSAVSSSITLKMVETPALSSTVEAYACIAPGIAMDKVLNIEVLTSRHKVSFKVKTLQTLEAGACYNIPLNLGNATEENNLSVEDYTPGVEPRMSGFKFTVADNPGKILATEAYYSSTGTATRGVSEKALTVSEYDGNGAWGDKGQVSCCIPYLYDFVLVPSFTVSAAATVTVGGTVQTSGVSAQDFSQPVTYTVTNAEGESRDYVVSVTNSGLPVVVLTDGGEASDDPSGDRKFLGMNMRSKNSSFVKTDKIAIYDKAGNQNLDEAACGFRLRGNSTQGYPKKPLAIKLNAKASVLGMPKHKRWVLLASWIDRSLIRNAVAFEIAETVQNAFTSTPDANGQYGNDGTNGLVWNPHGKNVELVLNGVHVGNYLLAEQIKIDKNRLAIQDGYEDMLEGSQDATNPGAAPTTANCGYLLEFDDNYDEPTKYITTKGNLPCMSKDDMSNGGSAIWSYVTGYIQDIENNLWSGNYTAAYEKLDINSVIDYWFVQELTMNDEFKHPKSVYMYKNGEGKLYAGPVWDFDWQTFPEISKINSFGGSYTLGYTYNTLLYSQYRYTSSIGNLNGDSPYLWYPKLFQDATFRARVKERWAVVYPVLQGIPAKIRELGEKNRVSDDYNKAIWPSDSYERKNWGISVAWSGDEKLGTYEEVIEQMVRVYNTRLEAMNAAIGNLK